MTKYKVSWRFAPQFFRTKKRAQEIGEAKKERYGYLYRVRKVKGGYKLYVTAGTKIK